MINFFFFLTAAACF